ncbi:hypothetical protein KORDIASMS9_03875 [Kordia sp. SMS9]|uniref:hypothetical protein n=1 Tax=Kordia sp. SMS9 TaxID=2282170 RepID=UPI000E0D2872|nr:hypothetical protein [Kordia sp. SMS9]AXG71618.1 hypothetical protein KORDIASMS9_03875 [Kordia sp. SMS9]
MSTSNPAAIIVFRHAHDLPTDTQAAELKKYNDEHPNDKRGESYYYIQEAKTYNLPDPAQGSVTLPWQRLSPDGFNEAQNIAADLPSWISQHWAPVNLVITKDPRSKDQTQNPFQTVIPSADALKASNKVEVQLKDDPGFNKANLISDGHSALICWDRQGLWQDEGDPAGTYILQSLAKANPLPGNITRPHKAGTFYVFTNPDTHGKYDISQYNYNHGQGFVKVA